MTKGTIDVLNKFADGWCGHCHRYQKIVYEAVIQWPDYPDYMVEGCMSCLEEISNADPSTNQ